MAKVTSRIELIEYCLRRLGFPVIEINVDDDQIQDRIDDTFDFYSDYHYDGTERVFVAIQLQQSDIDNSYITVADDLIFIRRAMPFGRHGSAIHPMGDPTASWDFHTMFGRSMSNGYSTDASTSVGGNAGVTNDLTLTTYFLNMQYMEQVNEMFGGGEIPMRFNRHTNRVYLDMDWADSGVKEDDYMMLEGWKVVDPEVYIDVYNDRWIKRYATAQIKKQWGANLIKYAGIALPGGVTLDGDKLFEEASQEIEKLEEEMQDKYEEPPMFIMG